MNDTHLKSILITGGTGTFGRSFAKTVLENYPHIEKVVIFSRDEFKQFEMSNLDWCQKHQKRLRFFVGDVRDKDRLLRAFSGIDVVVHAAALKQIPSCEYNPFEAIKTNVWGAQNVIEAALDCKVKRVVALSTDKACSPINLYGATKLCSDKLFISANSYAGLQDTRFAVVRYGNVTGSRGSLIPFFQKLVEAKADSMPITDERMTRFWLNIHEAVDLVLLALNNTLGGEIFVPKIPSVKITDIAKAIAPHIPIKIIGIRPGEKIHEKMISIDDARNTIEFDNYFVIQPDLNLSWAKRTKAGLKGTKVSPDFEYHSGNNTDWLNVDQVRKLIKKLNPENANSNRNLNDKVTMNNPQNVTINIYESK
ncbi:UDP-N-acetylglucosamine 4,6-dehydratase (inverting) [Candidatus Beckwithbacteria bacterium]|nr:UDP-N-acetylglucosamine 4,6-dehydratase (inverting) [Candidatus Beckwithbacteria bacterium]